MSCPLNYTIEISSDGGTTWGNAQTVSHPTTDYSFTGLVNGNYRVRVRANYSGGGVSSWVVSDPISLSYGPVVDDWIFRVQAKGGTVSPSTAIAHATFINALTTAGVWSKLSANSAIFTFATDTLTGVEEPLIKPAGVSPTKTGWVAGDYSLSTGLNPGTTNNSKYLDSGMILSGYAGSGNSLQLSIYLRSNSTNGRSAYQYGIGFDAGLSSRCFLICSPQTSDSNIYFQSFNSNYFASSTSPGSGLITGTKINSNSLSLARNGSAIGIQTLATLPNNAPNGSLFIGATNNGSGAATGHLTNIFSYALITPNDYLSSSEELAHYNAVQALQVSLGRAV